MTFLDIIKREGGEKLFRELIATDPDARIFVDSDGMIALANPQAEQLFGYTSQEMLGQPADLLLPTRFRGKQPDHPQGYFGDLQAWPKWTDFGISGLHKDGVEFPVELSRSPLETNAGVFISNVIRGMTMHKPTKVNRHRTQESLEQQVEGRPTELTTANESQQVEQILQKSEDHYRRLVELCPEPIIVHSQEKFVYLNDAAIKLFGATSPQELIGKPVASFIHPDDQQAVEEQIRESYEDDKQIKYLHRKIVCLDQQVIDIELSPISITYKKQDARLAVLKDITQQKQAEIALRESEERYRSLFENSPISLWEQDYSAVKEYLDDLKSNGVEDFRTYFEEHPETVAFCATLIKIIDVNQTTLKIYGAQHKEDFSGNLGQILTKEALSVFKEQLITIAEGKEYSWANETVNLTLNGVRLYLNLSWAVMPGYESTYSKVLVSAIDMTRQKQSEEVFQQAAQQFQALIDNTQDIIAILDRGGLFRYVSPSVIRILGYPPEDLIEKSITELIHPANGAKISRTLNEAKQPDKIIPASEYRLQHQNGSWHIFTIVITNLLDLPAVNGYLLNCHDITARKAIETELEQHAIFLALINDIGHKITTELDVDRILDRAAQLVQTSFSYHHVAIFLLDEDVARLKAVYGSYQTYFLPNHYQPLNQGIIGWVGTYGEKLLANNVSQEPNYISLITSQSTTLAELCLPIKIADQVLGVLDIQSPFINAFNDKDVIAMETLADQIAVALQNARLHSETERRAKQLAILHELDQALTTSLQINDVYHTLARYIPRLFPYDWMSITLIQKDKVRLTYVASRIQSTLKIGTILPLENSVTEWLAKRGHPLLYDHTALTEPFVKCEHPIAIGITSAMIVPLRAKGQVIGTLDIGSCDIEAYSIDNLKTAQSLADQLAIAIENARLHNETEQRLKEQTILRAASMMMFSTLDLGKVLHYIAEQMTIAMSATSAYIFSYEPEITTSTMLAEYTSERAASWEQVVKDTASYHLSSEFSRINKFLETEWSDLLTMENSVLAGLDQIRMEYYGTRTVLTIPLPLRGRLAAYIELWESRWRREFTADEINLCQDIGQQAAIAIEHARLFRAEQTERQRTKALQAAGATVSSSLELTKVLDRLLTELGKVINYNSASVFLMEADLMYLAAGHNLSDSSVIGQRFPKNELAEVINQTRQPLILGDIQGDSRYERLGNNDYIRCWMGVPLLARQDLIGYFTLDHEQAAFYNQADANLAMGFANHAAMAVEHARLYQGLQEQMQALQETQNQLVQSEKMAAIGQLSASIVHEVNNPLQAIQNAMALLEEELSGQRRPAKLNLFLSTAGEEIERVSEIMHRMRSFYRPAPKEMEAQSLVTLDAFYRLAEEEFELIALTDIMNSVLQLTNKALKKSQITLNYHFADDLPPIQGNADHLKQVFLNLVLNAIDAMAERGGILNVSAMLEQAQLNNDESLPIVYLQFSDTGVGVPKEALPRLFNPFFSTKTQGSGLGLSITRKIIDAHNGQISVESQMGLGTTFTIMLPIEQFSREKI